MRLSLNKIVLLLVSINQSLLKKRYLHKSSFGYTDLVLTANNVILSVWL